MAHKLIQRDEARQLSRLERHLHDLRIRLHYLAGRREDRLVFDLQTALARQLGHEDTPARLASEAMMQRYYQTAQGVTQLNTILLQNLEARLAPRPDTAPRALNERFEVRSELLHIQAGKHVRAHAERDPRVLPPHDAAPGAARHDGADAARAVAGAGVQWMRTSGRTRWRGCSSCTSCSSRAASCTSSAA